MSKLVQENGINFAKVHSTKMGRRQKKWERETQNTQEQQKGKNEIFDLNPNVTITIKSSGAQSPFKNINRLDYF